MKNADAVKTNKIQYVVNGGVGGTKIEGSRIRRLIPRIIESVH